ncbi:MAG: hypothetical protein RLY30_126 [Pseudomonadota bacterium]|jgi:two-component system nitrogen regulation sensor histidine kinase GlnL
MSDYSLFDLLSSAVILVDSRGQVAYANSSAQSLLGLSEAQLHGVDVESLIADASSAELAFAGAWSGEHSVFRQHLTWRGGLRGAVDLDTTIHTIAERGLMASVELRDPDAFQRIDREERQAEIVQRNQSLLRNLGHEVKNPLGGIRGAAQLLDAELPSASLREYTQVIIKESDRLQALVDRMLAPVRRSQNRHAVNIHEVLERVRRLILSEFPLGLEVRRDYDTSLPELEGDLEQLIQMVLNIVRNAAQALEASRTTRTQSGQIVLRTRAVRQVTLHRRRYRLAIALFIIDNGPGIPEAIREEIFDPLVSGHPQGHGLGLTIAQTVVHQHGGAISCSSSPSGSVFEVVLPLVLEGVKPQ